MSAIGQAIRELRERRGWGQEDVSRESGLPLTLVAAHEAGQRIPSLVDRRHYARAFGFPTVLDFDDEWRGQRRPTVRGEQFRRIPVINLVPAGDAGDYVEGHGDSGYAMDWIDRGPGCEGDNVFAFRVHGDSMEPDFRDGDVCVCEWVDPEDIRDGEAVFVRFGPELDSRCTFKLVRRVDATSVALVPCNPVYPRAVVEKQHIVRMAPVLESRRKTQRTDAARRLVGDAL